eukprot:8995724-Pyramimonas_sp.AAC.1
MPSILSIGLSCRADDTSKKRGRQFVHGCPYLPGDNRIQSGLLMDLEALILVSLKNLIRDNIPVWRPANDIVMTAGRNGRIPPTHIAQSIGILPNHMCKYNSVGQIWINSVYLKDDNQPYTGTGIDDMYETRNDASSSRNRFIPDTPIPVSYTHLRAHETGAYL